MEPIPQPVTNVRLWPYLPDMPIEVPPVFVNGAGTYAVGTLTTNIFYNLNLTSGTSQNGGVIAGSRYLARCTGSDGKEFTTPWLACLKGGPTPSLGRTIVMVHPAEAETASPDIAYQIHLKDVSVDLYVNPNEPLEVPLIRGANGLALFAGLLPGGSWSVDVTGGERVNPLSVGMRVSISGINVASGKPYNIPAVLVTKNAGDPAQFVQIKK